MIIVHLADVHIHNAIRHEQYREVFSEFYKRLEVIKPDAVVIVGDLAHNKTELSPEFVDLCSEFLINVSRLTKRLDLVVGNHDCNLKNRNRQNAISPIVSLIKRTNIENLTLFKKSGIYDINDKFRYVVYSILDDEKPVVDNSDKVTIALFHDIVDSAITDLDFSLSSNYKLDYFDGCDIGMFGDIHKGQSLDKEGRFRYAGSFIQQNAGESLDKGFLVWDIEDKNKFSVKKEFIYPKGLYCSLTIDENFNITESTKLLNNSNIKVYYPASIDKKKLHEFVSSLYTKYDANEVTPIKNNNISINSQKQNSKISFSLEKYLENKNIDLKEQIVALDRDIETKIDVGLFANRGLIWEIKELSWSNILAYGEDNKIDFTKLNGVTGVIAENRMGKSSLIDIILWTLFNETSKKSKKSSWIIHHGKKDAISKMLISTNTGDEYVIERKITRKKDSASTSVDFKKISGGIEISLNGIDRNETDRNIRQIFGTFDSFIMTSLAPSGMMNNFVKNIESERLNVLSTFLGLDVYKAKYKIAKEESDDLKSAIKAYKDVDFDKQIFEATSEVAIQETQYDVISRELENKKEKLSNVVSKIFELKSSLNNGIDVKESIDLLTEKKNELDVKVNNCNISLDEENKNVGEYLGKIFFLSEACSQINVDSSIEQSYSLNQKIIDKIENALIIVSKQKENIVKATSILDKVNCDRADCIFIKDAIEKKTELLKVDNEIENLTNELKSSSERKIEIENEYNKYKINKAKKESIQKEISSLNSKVNKSNSNINSVQQQLNNILNTLKTIQEKIDKVNKNKELIEQNNRINTEISTITSEQKEIENSVVQVEKKHNLIVQSIGAAKAKLQQSTDSKFKFFETKKKYDAYEKYLELTSRTGIQLEAIVENLEIINTEIHNVLVENGFSFDVLLEENEEKSGIELFIKDGDQKVHLELESGAEEAISSMAIRLALINICTLPKMSGFIIDEAFGAFDSKLLPKFTSIFDYIRKYFKNVIVITHISAIKDIVDSRIEIQRTDKESKIFV
jgi:DNA repair exonuclease SbcCD ATPase subunit